MAVIIIAIGLMITGIDLWHVLDVPYPAFHVDGTMGTHELSPSIQLYTTGNILGNQVKIDLLPDAIGCLLLFIGGCMLVKKNKEFIMAVIIQPILLFLLMSVLMPYTKEHSIGI